MHNKLSLFSIVFLLLQSNLNATNLCIEYPGASCACGKPSLTPTSKFSNWVVYCEVDINTIKDPGVRARAKRTLGKGFFGKNPEEVLSRCKPECFSYNPKR